MSTSRPHSKLTDSGSKMRIRDHMDEILEARGYYRKHVANEGDALFRAISDVLFDSQSRRFVLEHALQVGCDTPRGRLIVEAHRNPDGSQRPHLQIHLLADWLNVVVEILESSNPEISTLRIEPGICPGDLEARYPLRACQNLPLEMSNRKSSTFALNSHVSHRASSKAGRNILLCYNGPAQYDPVYSKQTIDNAGMVQSILYEMLYSDIFGMRDAYKAAEQMLYGYFDPRQGKPEFYDKDFIGSGMEALANDRIPFPYKVAKALDPNVYRNIEYDVWSCEKRPSKTNSPSRGHGGNAPPSRPILTLGSLNPGKPCVIRDYLSNGRDNHIYGHIIKPCSDRRLIEVFLPSHRMSINVPRKMVMPIQEIPPEVVALWQDAEALFYDQTESAKPEEVQGGINGNYYPYSHVESGPGPSSLADPNPQQPTGQDDQPAESQHIQSQNIQLAASRDPKWVEKSNFSVPPPLFKAVRPPLDPLAEMRVVAEIAATLKSRQFQEGWAEPVTPGVVVEPSFPWPGPQQHYGHPLGPSSPDPAILMSRDQNGNFNTGSPYPPGSPLPPMVTGVPCSMANAISTSSANMFYNMHVYSPHPYDMYSIPGTPQFPFTPISTPTVSLTPLTGGSLFPFPSSPMPMHHQFTPIPPFIDPNMPGSDGNYFVFPSSHHGPLIPQT